VDLPSDRRVLLQWARRMRSNVETRGSGVHLDEANADSPLHDTRSNAKALLPRTCSSCMTTAWRERHVWGAVRYGNPSGGAPQRYSVNVGHLADDESGFLSLRAQFSMPLTGRFVGEDTVRDGLNWYSNCRNSPITTVAESGTTPNDLRGWSIVELSMFYGMMVLQMSLHMLNNGIFPMQFSTAVDVAVAGTIVLGFAWAATGTDNTVENDATYMLFLPIHKLLEQHHAVVTTTCEEQAPGHGTVASSAVLACSSSSFLALGLLGVNWCGAF
jgi:RHS repeat-associated protein